MNASNADHSANERQHQEQANDEANVGKERNAASRGHDLGNEGHVGVSEGCGLGL